MSDRPVEAPPASSDVEAARARVASLVGQTCWSALGGEPGDWTLVLDLGEQVRRSLRLGNRRLSFQQRTFEGSFGLLVECPWRLDGPEAVLTSCLDEPEPRGRLRAGLVQLEGLAVTAATLGLPGGDLSLSFDRGLTLEVFAAEAHGRTVRENWSLFTPAGQLTVGWRGRLKLSGGGEGEEAAAGTDLMATWRARWKAAGRVPRAPRPDDEDEGEDE